MKNLIKKLLDAFGEETCLVGGSVRDKLLSRPICDIDILLKAGGDAEKKLNAIAAKSGFAFFPLDEREKIYRMVFKKDKRLFVDISLLKEKNLAENLAKRDFTINAMAHPAQDIEILPKNGYFSIKGFAKRKVLDPFSGMDAIKRKRLELLNGEKTIAEDPLRILRAFRISAQLGFSISPSTLRAIKKNAPLIRKSSPERIKEELSLIMKEPDSARHLGKIIGAGVMFEIIPELRDQVECARVYYGKGGVLKHTLRVIERTDFFCENAQRFSPHGKKLADYLREKPLLKTTALLHDIAKPAKAGVVGNRLRFFGHDHFGAVMAESIMKRLRYSKREIKTAKSAIASHLRPGNLASNDFISERALYRLFRDLDENSVYLLILCWADHSSYISEKQLKKNLVKTTMPPAPIPKGGLPKTGLKKTLRFLQVINLMFGFYFGKYSKAKSDPLITGKDVIKTLKIPESPLIGRILGKVRMLQFEGKLKNRKEALKYIKTLKAAPGNNPLFPKVP